MIVVPTDKTMIADQLLHTVKPTVRGYHVNYLAGCLASSAVSYFFRKRFNRTEKTFPEIRVTELASLPIRIIDFDNPADVERHDRMVSLVQQMLDLHEQRDAARTDQDKQHLDRLITATDDQVDQLVYELYDLTDEEIAIVEGEVG